MKTTDLELRDVEMGRQGPSSLPIIVQKEPEVTVRLTIEDRSV